MSGVYTVCLWLDCDKPNISRQSGNIHIVGIDKVMMPSFGSLFFPSKLDLFKEGIWCTGKEIRNKIVSLAKMAEALTNTSPLINAF